VAGTGRSAERLQVTADRLKAGDRFLGVAGDVADPDSARRAFERAIAAFGHVDVLVNNAGVFTAKPFVAFAVAEIDEQISINLKGMLFHSQEAARHMIERGRGCILSITASLALQPDHRVPALMNVALKGAVNQATRALALELAPSGVRVNAVAPGVVATPMHGPDVNAAYGALHPLGRVATIDEICDAVVYVAHSDHVTGVVLPVDGGSSAGR
jgi:NAD(P)-dependent dehydrogenase (short-subunit alcohol dehydrogenase family)